MKTRKDTTKAKGGSKQQSLVGRVREKRRNRRAQRRADRQEATIAFVKRNKVHGVPLVLDGAMLSTGIAATIDPTAGLVTGAATSVPALAGAGFQLESRREIGLVGGHLAAGMGWATSVGVFGLGNPYVDAAGVFIAGVAQISWIDQRKTAKTPKSKVKKSVSEQWNTPEHGILARAGADGARMYKHATVHNRDGAEIGDDFEVDLSGTDTSQDAFCGLGQKIAEKMGGKIRRGAVNVYPDKNDVNHCTVRAIWIEPWKPVSEDPSTVVEHPVVKLLPELSKIVDNAIERRSNPDVPALEIPDHVKPWLPQMRSYVDPVPVGEREDRSTYWLRNYKKKFGVMHLFALAESGGGKTSFINSEIASELPCRDVIFWVIDVSTKQGQDFAGWGSCIDWMATNAGEALKMLRAAVRIAKARGDEYKDEAGSIRSPKQVPTIKLIVDEIAALYDELEDDLSEELEQLARQGRTQGVQVQLYDQTGVQMMNMRGFKNVLRNMHRRAVLKVSASSTISNALRNTDVPYDMTHAPEGVLAYEDHQSDHPEVWRAYYVDTGDPDEGEPGVIAPIASIYAPFRPELDAASAKAGGEDYANRAFNRQENPLLTPDEVIMSHAPVHPVETEDDLAENVANIKTGSDWINAILNGELTMDTPHAPAPEGSEDEDVPAPTPRDMQGESTNFRRVLKDKGVPMSTSDRGRQERRQMTRDQHDQRASNLDAALADMETKQAQIKEGTTIADAAGSDGQDLPSYPDDDPVMAAAIELLRTQASKGTTTKDIAEKSGKKKADTVVARLRYLQRTDRAVRVGEGKAARWYHPDSAPSPQPVE